MTDRPVLVMSPAKVINHFGRTRFASVVPEGSVLITSGPVDVDADRLAVVAEFDEYTTNDEIPLAAEELIIRHGLARIVVLAEADILRAAEIRRRLGIPGQSPEDALHFRDKTLMKRAVSGVDIAVAPHREVRSALELHDAVAELGYPCVVKPPHGRGSSGVSVLDNEGELRDFLRSGPFSDRGRTYPWLVEAFLAGEQYRVDGVCRNGRVVFSAVAVYVNTHLDFLDGGYMGSVMLPVESQEAQTILELARAVMEDALPAFDGAFHLEAFLTPDGPVFSEVGSRIGGGSINEEVELSYGFNLVEESILAQREVPFRHTSVRQRSLAGQLNVSPHSGVLAEAPEGFEHPDVSPFGNRRTGPTLLRDDTYQRRIRPSRLPCRLSGVRPHDDLKAPATPQHIYQMEGHRSCGVSLSRMTTRRCAHYAMPCSVASPTLTCTSARMTRRCSFAVI